MSVEGRVHGCRAAKEALAEMCRLYVKGDYNNNSAPPEGHGTDRRTTQKRRKKREPEVPRWHNASGTGRT